MTQLNAALFIDYDNIVSELERYDPAVAARFSNKTLLWIQALERHLPLPEEQGFSARRIVSRRCFASPQRMNNYRRNFTQTGVEVIDCPPLTTHLKNSADIYIVMDVIDYLQRYPHIEEFIILSADADFVPVLNRLRKELKRSVIFTSYNTTSAYRNCSDDTIEADFFARHLAVEAVAPRVAQESAPAPATPPDGTAPRASNLSVPGVLDAALAAAIEACLVRAAARRFGQLPFATAAQALRSELGEDLGASWAGHRTFSILLEHVALARLEVDWDTQRLIDPDFVVDLAHWQEADRERLVDFVTDIEQAATKSLPLLPPSAYTAVFETLAAHFSGPEPGTFSEAMEAVSSACTEQGEAVTVADVRAVATGISTQQYRFGEPVEARHLAALWRAQVFDLCREPDWMRDPEEAELLVTWMRAADESVESARDEFIARTADEPPGDAPGA